MAQPLRPAAESASVVETFPGPFPMKNEASSSSVSWAAISSGAFVTAALFLALLALGAGAGLSSLSPWANSGASPDTVRMGAILWLMFAEILSCAVGGYVAGRLRTKWVDVHSDEVYFRDTAHGFLLWAVALVVTAAFLTSAATSMVGGENRNSASQRSESSVVDTNRYFVDSLFRSTQSNSVADEAQRSEAGLILAHALRTRELSGADRTYLTELVAAHTGLNAPEADKRVNDVFESNRDAADTARRAIAHSLYWLFVALLLGAFAASFWATLGGRQRDGARLTRA